MFDKYLIATGSLRNIVDGTDISGFAFDVRIGYYRGLAVSMVEPFDIIVDGGVADPDSVRFTASGVTLSFKEMESRDDVRWEMIDDATITVLQPGGLAPGEHKVALTEHLRVSYLPFVAEHHDEKVLSIAG